MKKLKSVFARRSNDMKTIRRSRVEIIQREQTSSPFPHGRKTWQGER
jgi:hypothetical protein